MSDRGLVAGRDGHGIYVGMPERRADPELPPGRILAVDDVPANLLALEAILERLGADIATAKSGAEALEVLTRGDVAVVLLDVQMPGMDGYTTLERMRQGPARDTPVIFLTAYPPSPDAVQRAYRLGAFDFITKPVDPDVLRGKVRAFVSHHQRGHELRLQTEALKTKDRLLAVLAHDLRTPLAVVHMAAHVLPTASPEQVPSLAARILRSTERMQHLARDLLESARAASALPAKKHVTDLGELCEALLDDFRTTYPDVQFVESIARDVVGLWDRDRLYQAVSNLLSNAVKYGDGRVTLDVVVKPHGWASVTVSNGGAPIPDARLPDIFEPFVQGRGASTGVGLGLYIVREIAIAHGGEVVVASNGSGTTFTIRLPVGSAATRPPPSAS